MNRLALALVACAFVGCGGDEGGEGRTVEDFVDPGLLEQVENEVQSFCLISNSIITERADECGLPLDTSQQAWKEGCFLMEPPMTDMQKEQAACHEAWAFGDCASMFGPESDPCVLVIER